MTEDDDGVPFDSHVLAVRCDSRILKPAYLSAYLRSPSGQAQVEGAKGANTTKQTELGKAKLEAFVVPLPPIEEQHNFLAHLDRLEDELDELGTRMTERARVVDALLAAAMNEAFAGLS